MSKLVIVESPSKIKSIKKALGRNYTVMASKGHIRDLPKSKLGIDVEDNYKPQYINMSDKKDVIKELKEAAKKSDMVYLATDPDREGEAISWHLAQILGLDMNESNRVCFNEITKSGIEAGMKNPRQLDLSLVDAQQARRVLDRIVGYKLSPFLWKKVKRGLSAGRVQSVALRLIVDREEEIEAFNSEEYWTIDANFKKDDGQFTAHFHGTASGKKVDLLSEADVNKVLGELEGSQYEIGEVKKSKRNVQPAPPFTTSTLQQEAARKLNFTGQRTMSIAQQLYEGIDVDGSGTTGLITYMRTDSLRISEEARGAVTAYVTERYGQKYLPEKPRYFKSKASAQDAHEAIRPTNIFLTPEKAKSALSPEQFKLYKLIWERFISSLMAVSVNNVVNVSVTTDKYMFKATETTVAFDGFTVLYQEGKDSEEEKSDSLPKLSSGDLVTLSGLDPKQHYTQPPARYTESTLIKALDENGIGRPSTYAPIISNILSKEYIERLQKSFKPTVLGRVVTGLMIEYFPNIVDVKFTANMENDLDMVEKGNAQWVKVVDNFYGDFEATLETAEKTLEGQRVKIPEEETDVVCELCGRKMVVKSGRFGKFLACPGYPECKNAKPMPEDEVKEPCPKCGAKLLKRKSKKGKTFYGCSNYPECDFAAPGIPTGEICEECGGFMLKGTRGKTYCINSECPTRVALREKSAAKKGGAKKSASSKAKKVKTNE